MRRFITQIFGGLQDTALLDVGAGKGGISLAFAECSKFVIGMEISNSNSRDAAHRNRNMAGADEFIAVTARAEQLPFKSASFDLILANGLLEWVGLGSQDPRTAQERAIREFSRVLRADGCLYLAIENRLFPAFLILDPHTHLPFVNILPRQVSRGLTRGLSGRAFGNYIYSKKGLTELLALAFRDIRFFLPIPHYHIPLSFVDLSAGDEIRRQVRAIRGRPGLSTKLRLTIAYDSICAMLGLTGIAAPYFVVLATKG